MPQDKGVVTLRRVSRAAGQRSRAAQRVSRAAGQRTHNVMTRESCRRTEASWRTTHESCGRTGESCGRTHESGRQNGSASRHDQARACCDHRVVREARVWYSATSAGRVEFMRPLIRLWHLSPPQKARGRRLSMEQSGVHFSLRVSNSPKPCVSATPQSLRVSNSPKDSKCLPRREPSPTSRAEGG